VGCGMCTLVCPNGAIAPMHAEGIDKLRFMSTRAGTRGGRPQK